MFVVTTWNWRGTGKCHTEQMALDHCFQDLEIGETRLTLRYAITRIA